MKYLTTQLLRRNRLESLPRAVGGEPVHIGDRGTAFDALQDAKKHMQFRWLEISQLESIYEQWRNLAVDAATPNPDYGPDIIMAYATVTGLPDNVAIASVWSLEGETERLDALAFYVRRDLRWGWPVRTWVSWSGPHFDSSEPLIRKSCAMASRSVLYDGLSNGRTEKTLIVGKCQSGSADDPLTLLDASLERHSILDRQAVVFSHQRAALSGHWQADDYARSGITKKAGQNVRRSIRKLEAMGALQFETVTGDPHLKIAVADFLALEGRSWKGAQRTALVCRDEDRRFAEMALDSGSTPEVACDVLSLDGKAIAVNVNLIAGNCLFGFKSAFDEEYRKFSPGNVAHYFAALSMLRERKLIMADSVSTPGHPIESIWPDRLACGRVLQSVGAPMDERQFERCLMAERMRKSIRARSGEIYNTLLRRKVTGANRP